MEIPAIETPRLRLRGWRMDDARPMTAIYEHETARFIGGVGGYPHAWRVVAAEVGHWVLRGYGMWALDAKDDGRFVGFCGLWHPGDWPELEIGWNLMPAERGQGFATEAAEAGRDWTYRQLGVDTLVSYIAPENAPSLRVAQRLSCVRDGDVDLSGKIRQVWRHPSPQALT